MTIPFPTHLGFLVLIISLAASSPSSDDPPKPANPWLNALVMFKTADVRVRDEKPGPWNGNLGFRFYVNRAEGDHLWIARGPVAPQSPVEEIGWVLSSEVVLFEHAEAYFTEQIKTTPTYYDYLARSYSRPNSIKPRIDPSINAKEDELRMADVSEAIRLGPVNSAAYMARGVMFSIKKEPDRAIADFTEAIRANSIQKLQRSSALVSRAMAYTQKGDLDRAFADYDEAIRDNPKNYWAYHFKAMGLSTRNDHEAAIALYTKFIEADPDNGDGYYSRGRYYFSRGSLDKALADFEVATLKSPKDLSAKFQRGWVKEFKMDYAGAISDFDEVINLNPKYPKAYCRRAECKQAKKDYDGAIADFDEALKQNPKDAEAIKGHDSIRKILGG